MQLSSISWNFHTDPWSRLMKKRALDTMNKILLRTLLPICIGCMAACAQHGTIEEITFHSRSLEENLIGDSPDRAMYVYLPPSYFEKAERRYPVIYLLHGYQGSYTQWMSEGAVWNIRDVMDSLINGMAVREMIIVMPDALNQFGGSFYTNSATTGNWEDYIAKDLTQYIDGNYRTLAHGASRGIAGHSMGGYGALKLAMKHPHVFGAVYSLSACCLGWGGDLSSDNDAWNTTLSFTTMDQLASGKEDYLAQAFLAMSAAWSADPENPPFYVQYPVQRSGKGFIPDSSGYSRWTSNMPVSMVDQYRSNLKQIRGIAFDMGLNDQFTHIPLTNRLFSQVLSRNEIEHHFEQHDGDHNSHAAKQIEEKLLPFFSRVLQFETQ
jgi:S-formylglutathione hydrolase